jgi:glutamate dehydrogenase (NAD(P)+)
VNNRLESKMTKAFQDVEAYAKKENSDLRRAALVIAVNRVVSAMKLSGWH